jgi:hypothetical protein
MSVYLNRKDQTKHLRKRGVKIGDTGLANMATKGKGPRFCIINGLALSTEKWLDEWIAAEASIPRRREKAASEPKHDDIANGASA